MTYLCLLHYRRLKKFVPMIYQSISTSVTRPVFYLPLSARETYNDARVHIDNGKTTRGETKALAAFMHALWLMHAFCLRLPPSLRRYCIRALCSEHVQQVVAMCGLSSILCTCNNTNFTTKINEEKQTRRKDNSRRFLPARRLWRSQFGTLQKRLLRRREAGTVTYTL